METYGEYLPKVTKIAEQLEAARAQLAALPRPALFEDSVPAAPWEHREERRAAAVLAAEEVVRDLETKLAAQSRNTLQHVIDLVSCVPQERDNYHLLREAERYLLALAKIQESLA